MPRATPVAGGGRSLASDGALPPRGGPGIPDLSIVIVNRNTRDLLERCLTSIRDLPDRLSREVIVVDNGSSDGSPEMVESLFPDTVLLRNSTNTGFAFPNNQGMELSAGRYVMLLNSDTEVRPWALDRLMAFLETHPEVGACGPRLSYPDGRLQPSCFSFDSPWRVFCDMIGLGTIFPRSPIFGNQQRAFDHSRTGPTESLMGAAIMVRREILEIVGLLDTRFRIHSNEVDWCYRMYRAGWARYFVADADVIHYMGSTLKVENEDFRMQGEMLQNLFDYHRKHYGVAGLLWFRLWFGIGYGVRALWYPIRNRVRPSPEGFRLSMLAPGYVRAALLGAEHAFDGGHHSGGADLL